MFGMDKDTTAILFGFLTVLVNGVMAYYMRKLEKNTNSMKDALVKSTADSSRAQGMLEGKAESRTERIADAATLKSEVSAPAPTQINMEVEKMDVAEFNVPVPKDKK